MDKLRWKKNVERVGQMKISKVGFPKLGIKKLQNDPTSGQPTTPKLSKYLFNSQKMFLLLLWSQATACTSDIPEDNSGNDAVLINFYNNPDRGTEGDLCPVACSTPTATQWYKIASSGSDNCLQWPGRSGENSMMHGTCHPDTSSYSYSQWITCDCSGLLIMDKCWIYHYIRRI